MIPDLVKTTELFLIPSSFLVAALGTADTNLHRAAVSALGLAISLLWSLCGREAVAEAAAQKLEWTRTARFRILAWFPIVFLVGWLISLVAHILLIGKPLGTD